MIKSLRAIAGRRFSTNPLDAWIAQPKSLALTDTLTETHLADLYITLPTRDGTRGQPYQPPVQGTPLGYGHHLAFFHPRHPESALRPDGTDADFCPPEPFTRRMWASGTMRWNPNPGGALSVGDRAHALSTIASVEKKGLDAANTHPMVFVKQRIQVTAQGHKEPSVVEERSHVYLASRGSRRGAREGMMTLCQCRRNRLPLCLEQCQDCRGQTSHSLISLRRRRSSASRRLLSTDTTSILTKTMHRTARVTQVCCSRLVENHVTSLSLQIASFTDL